MAELQGAAELRAALLRLPGDVEKKVLRKSAIAGARVVRDAVKALAPISAKSNRQGVPPGTIRRAVTLKFAKELSGRGKSSYVVTIRRGKSQQKSNRDAYYWIWVERGHRIVGKGGVPGGRVAPHPFFVPAYQANEQKAAEKMRATMEDGVAAIIAGKV